MEKLREQLFLPEQWDYPLVKREISMAWRELARLLNGLLTVYYQTDMPTPPMNTTSLWIDTDAGPKYYIVANLGGTVKKVELGAGDTVDTGIYFSGGYFSDGYFA